MKFFGDSQWGQCSTEEKKHVIDGFRGLLFIDVRWLDGDLG
jgi:hypothetical protein